MLKIDVCYYFFNWLYLTFHIDLHWRRDLREYYRGELFWLLFGSEPVRNHPEHPKTHLAITHNMLIFFKLDLIILFVYCSRHNQFKTVTCITQIIISLLLGQPFFLISRTTFTNAYKKSSEFICYWNTAFCESQIQNKSRNPASAVV